MSFRILLLQNQKLFIICKFEIIENDWIDFKAGVPDVLLHQTIWEVFLGALAIKWRLCLPISTILSAGLFV